MQLAALQGQWPALNRLLDQALALAPADRAAWLDALGGADAGLRPTLEHLLALQARIATADFLRRRPAWPPPGTGPELRPEAALQAGDAVGPYRLQRCLGHGGMGTVWLAERADGGLKRPVALKLPRLAWDDGIAARMARERDILAALDHPHIARLHDAGFDQRGRPWLALEYVEGQAIDQHADGRGLDLRARVGLLLQAASAVAYAHARQVVHRDLKPSNMLVGADGRVRLLDFGIARLLHGGAAGGAGRDPTALTRIGERALTVAYASPEQLRGEPAGPASDVWSLGVIAYELLAGTRPYRLGRGSAAELEEAIASAEIEAPSRRAADPARARALKGDLDAVVLQALQRDPARRTASAQALAADLQRYLAGEAVGARREGWAGRGLRLLRRLRHHRLAVGAALGVAAALAIAVGLGPTALVISALAAGLVLAGLEARRARREAALAQAQTRRADAVQQLLSAMLEAAGIDAGSAEARHSLTIVAWLEQAAQALRSRPAADAAVHEAMLQLVSRLQQGLGASASAAALRQEWLQRLEARGAPAIERAQACRAWGESLADAERLDDAAAAFEQGLAALGAAAEPGAALQAALLGAQLGLVRLRQGRLEAAAQAIAAPAAALQACGDADRAELLGALASLRGEQGRVDDAYGLYRQAVAADTAAGRLLQPSALDRRHRLIALLMANQQYAAAHRELESALAVVEAAAGADHPAAVRLRERLAQVFSMRGRGDEAAEQLQRAEHAVRRAPAAFAPTALARLQLRRAELLLDEGRVEAAGPPLDAAMPALRQAPAPELNQACVLQARWLVEVGRFDEALALLDEARAWRAASFGADHAYTLSVDNRIVVAHIAAGRFDEADALIARILAVPAPSGREAFGSPQDLAASNRALLLIERGRFEAARPLAMASLAQLLALPPAQRGAIPEISLRLRCARALLGCGRAAEARPQLQRLDELAQRLHAHAPLRVPIDTAWAEALWLAGDPAAAAQRLAQARGPIAAQPSLGPQLRRYPERVAALLASTRSPG